MLRGRKGSRRNLMLWLSHIFRQNMETPTAQQMRKRARSFYAQGQALSRGECAQQAAKPFTTDVASPIR